MDDREDIDYSLIVEVHKSEITQWVECYLAQTPPTYEDCREHFEKKNMHILKKDYETACKKMSKKPRYR